MDHKQFKSKWGRENNNLIFDQKADCGGFSWPLHQRNFMCNFCNKEYKSAQALGGHMNVHRRDRAKLRLSSPDPPPPPPLDHQHQPPNPKCVSPVRYQPYKTYHSSSLLFPHVSTYTTNIEKDEQQHPSGIDFLGCMGNKNNMTTMELDGEKEEGNGIRVWKKTTGIFNDMKMEKELGLLLKNGNKIELLDLELRLGRS